MKKFLGSCLLVLGLSACVGTTYKVPDLSSSAIKNLQEEMQQEAIEHQIKRRKAMYDLAWPLIEKNTELCSETKHSIGLVLADRKSLGAFVAGMDERQFEKLGYPEKARIFHVMAGSPAKKADLPIGGEIIKVGEVEFEKAKPAAIIREIAKGLKKSKSISLKILKDEQIKSYTVKAVEVCKVAVKLSSSSEINAYATNNSIIITAGLMRTLSPQAVQFVMGHELAHQQLKHPNKVMYNSVVSGGVVVGPVLYGGGWVLDQLERLTPSKRTGSYALRAASIIAPYGEEFEAEADYLGLYMFKRAGGDVGAAIEAFDVFSKENPSNTWLKYTHPLTPERVQRAKLAMDEMTLKERSGEEMGPNKN